MAKLKKPSSSKDMTDSKLIYAATDTNFIRSWRLFRGFESHDALSKATVAHDPAGEGLSRSCILRLETGETKYHQGHLAILSNTLRVAERDLIGTDPYNAGDIFALYAGMTAADKRRAAAYIERLAKHKK